MTIYFKKTPFLDLRDLGQSTINKPYKQYYGKKHF